MQVEQITDADADADKIKNVELCRAEWHTVEDTWVEMFLLFDQTVRHTK